MVLFRLLQQVLLVHLSCVHGTGNVGLQQTVSDTSELTGLPSFGHFNMGDYFFISINSGSSDISGSFTSGFGLNTEHISGSALGAFQQDSFGRVDNILILSLVMQKLIQLTSIISGYQSQLIL